MDLSTRFLQFLQCYEQKDLAGIVAMLAPDVHVRDWNVSLRGRAAAEDFMRRNFDEAESLAIEVLHLHTSADSVAGEVRVVVNGTIELLLVDVIRFDAEGRVAALRSYKGRPD